MSKNSASLVDVEVVHIRALHSLLYTSQLSGTMRRWLALAVQFIALATSICAKSSTGDSVLVVLEKDQPKERFSRFFNGLEGSFILSRFSWASDSVSIITERGYDLTFREPKDKTPLVIEDDVPQFSHVILFSPTTKCKDCFYMLLPC